jgi:MFS family permease
VSEFGVTLGLESPFLWVLVVSSIAFAYSFYKHQLNSQKPMLPPHVLGHSTVQLLSILSFLSGLMLFILVFYMPLLLQAGFSLSPKISGSLVTPILVGITIGSIVNGQLIIRLEKTRYIYCAGILLLVVGLLMLTHASRESSHVYILAAFAFCGLGFGFQIPNLTLQMQSAVSRADLGSASALVQTLRTVGSMFGASVGGFIVNISFAHSVVAYLNSSGVSDSRIAHLFSNPQILIREGDRTQLQQITFELGKNSAELLDHARLYLIQGIEHALWFSIAIAIIAIYLSLKLPNIHQLKSITRDSLAETPNDYL